MKPPTIILSEETKLKMSIAAKKRHLTNPDLLLGKVPIEEFYANSL